MRAGPFAPSVKFLACFLFILTCVSSRLPAAEPNTLTPEELADGWILLFDGETTYGWRTPNEIKANWTVVDGALVATVGENSLLYTTSQFGNYQLKVDFRSAKGANSGVFLRTPPVPNDVKTRCYELNIADSDTNPFPTGSFVQRQKVEGNYDSDDWQSFDVIADGSRFVVKLDGKVVLEYTDSAPVGRGYIGLQFNGGKIEFRNVKLKPLGVKSLFNGKDLAGWKTFPELPSVFTVTPEGWINVKNGRGMLETEGQYDDFTLQLECFSNGEKLNSGVFFLSVPGETMNGY